MKNLYIVPIEIIETRYTKHWYTALPEQFQKNTVFNVKQIDIGIDSTHAPQNSEGGFFNFSWTCSFKSKQVSEISRLFQENQIKDGDIFFFADYWHPGVVFLRYMASMTNVNIKIVGVCHAGLWDPADLLTQKIENQPWGKSTENTLYECYDHLVFATEFSINLYHNYFPEKNVKNNKAIVLGFPMEYMETEMPNYWNLQKKPQKENIVVFPHRKSVEKNIDTFYWLSELMPEYKFIVSLDVCKTKKEYQDLLYRSKVTFSAATQETLGISMGVESLAAQCIPIVPNRLSYSEIYSDSNFLYDSDQLDICMNKIKWAMENYEQLVPNIREQRKTIDKWFTGDQMYKFLNSLES